ncbi:MAG: pyridoxine 5'-phosphate synthase [Desulfobulbaceae bacterium]
MPVNIEYHLDTIPVALAPALLHQRADQLLRLLHVAGRTVSLVFMDDRQIAAFNRKYRGKKGPTNVLSFPVEPAQEDIPPAMLAGELGDIMISVETATREAEEEHKELCDRLTELIIHGLLHLLGHDHERSEEEARRMWTREQELLHELQYARREAMTHLAVNVDHVATVRQARRTIEPDPVTAAAISELAGAAGIVVHLREDRRHIQDRDVRLLRQTVKTRLNLEMAASSEMLAIAAEIRPDMVTLVPEKRQELTTEGGLDVKGNSKKISRAIARLTESGIPVSLFIDPDAGQIKAAGEAGATYVELHTGRYCDAKTGEEREKEFALIEESAVTAYALGLRVNAGHGLDYRNSARVAALDTITELSIGHAIISRAVFVGLDQAVREMLAVIRPPFPRR